MISGYAVSMFHHHNPLPADANLINKPIRIHAPAQKIRVVCWIAGRRGRVDALLVEVEVHAGSVQFRQEPDQVLGPSSLCGCQAEMASGNVSFGPNRASLSLLCRLES